MFHYVKGVKLHYVEAGNKDKPVLLLLHGFPDCWISWRYQIPALALHYRVIALDLKGFGDSDKPESRKCYRLDILMSEIAELISSLGVSNVSIIGHDLGALLGWFMVHLYQDLVNKFVAISCPHPNIYWSSLPNTSSFNTSWIHYSQLPHLPELDALRDDLSIINHCYKHLSSDEASKPYLDAYKYSFSRKEDWTGPINYYRNLPFWRVNVGDSEPSVRIPCLLIVGNHDSGVKLESIVKSTEYLEKFAVKVVEGVGHFPHQECPNDVNKALINFFVGNKTKLAQKTPSGGLVFKMFDAVSSTMKYGNQVLDIVQKKTNGLTSKAFYVGESSTT
ncbi:epoxide hydrolase 4-like isoform X2 [Lycorma delicatula]|uniref:epoxide hydrolase 4-like isoform X2 n=1 Tax=Lycorma delicatula TaxID=130591 RepID=UPI003F515715